MKLRLLTGLLRRIFWVTALSASLLGGVPQFVSARPQAPPSPSQTPSAQGAVPEDVARFRAKADAALASAGADRAYWGLVVTDADTGEILYALNSERYFQPASNVKLFTTALALATLGPAYRIRTTIETAGTVDAGGRLQGDVVLVGRGDANLSNRVFPYSSKVERSGPPEKVLADLADQVARSGVKQVTGDVVADDSYFALTRFPPGWTVDDTVWSYGAAVSAIAVNDNSLTIDVRPGATLGAPLITSLDPLPSLYEVENRAATSAKGTEQELRLARDPDSRVFELSGSLPLDAQPRPLLVAVTQPAENAAVLLKHLLEARGIRVEGSARAVHGTEVMPPPPAEAPRVLAEHLSPALLDDVHATNKLSLNLQSELLLRVAAKEKGGAMTLDDAVKFAAQFYQAIGISADDLLLYDGSGLSRANLVTPRSITQLLAWAGKQDWGADYAASLPAAGDDGTLANRMKNTAAVGRVRAKTGSFDHVESLSGYATSLRGEHLIFSMFGNNAGLHTRDAAAVVDALCVAMVEELGPAPAVAPEESSSGRSDASSKP